jgi:GWxTD domain-containing protein
MSRSGIVLRILPVVVLVFVSGLVSAQNKQPQTPDDKDRKVKREENRAFHDWPKKDVSVIITAEEANAYNKLTTDEERQNFIADFWRRRDPSPDTEENEYKDEYYERLAYANEHFSSGKAGWQTDRGRIYIKWGKPDSVDSHPSGGAYQRQSYEGSGSTITYPFETWFYRSLPNVGSGIEIQFIDPTGSGEFRIANSLSEKEIPGLGNSTRADLEPRNYERHQDGPFEMIELKRNLDAQQPVRGNSLSGASRGTPVLDDNTLNFEIKPYYFQQADGRVVAAFTVQTPNRELVFQPSGGLQMARLNVFGKVVTVTEQKLGGFEETLTTTATLSELTEAKERFSVYGKAVVLPSGRYRLDVLLRDVNSGAVGFQQLAFTVPKFDTTKLETSSIVLAAKLESLKDRVPDNQFTIGLTKVVPNISGEFHRGAPVGVYLQVYNAGIDQTTLRPAADVEYAVLKDGKEISKRVEDWTGMSEAGQRLTLARLIDTRGLTPGAYEVQIRIRDHVTGQTLSPSAKFTVVP